MWWWVLVWVLLVVIAVVYLAMRGWAVWGQLKELRAEIVRASEVVATLEVQMDRLGDSAPTADLAVFGTPQQARANRDRTRASLRAERLARRDARMPRWARTDGS